MFSFHKYQLSFYVNKKKILANDADLIDIHRRTRNIIYKMMVEILICLEMRNSYIHIVVYKSNNVKVCVVQISSKEIESYTYCTNNNT